MKKYADCYSNLPDYIREIALDNARFIEEPDDDDYDYGIDDFESSDWDEFNEFISTREG